MKVIRQIVLLAAAMVIGACAHGQAELGTDRCFQIAAEAAVEYPVMTSPAAVQLLPDRHGRQNEEKRRLRMSASKSPTAPRYWTEDADGQITIAVLGGMWGMRLVLRPEGEGYQGVFEGWSDLGDEEGRYDVRLTPVGCGGLELDEGGPLLEGHVIGLRTEVVPAGGTVS